MNTAYSAKTIALALKFIARFDIRYSVFAPPPDKTRVAFIARPWPGMGLTNLKYCEIGNGEFRGDVLYKITNEGLRVSRLKRPSEAVLRAIKRFRS